MQAPAWPQARAVRWWHGALWIGLIALHAALLLLPRQRLILHRQDPMALIYLPQPQAATPAAHPAPTRPRAAAHEQDHAPITVPPSEPAQIPAQAPPPPIDWSQEASIAAQHQAELANAPQPRSLDNHARHGNHADGVGLNSHDAPTFGWNETAIHRFDTRSGLPMIRLSDRCVLPLGLLIPLPVCGFGKKIEPRGDLFDHMHDAPATEAVP